MPDKTPDDIIRENALELMKTETRLIILPAHMPGSGWHVVGTNPDGCLIIEKDEIVG